MLRWEGKVYPISIPYGAIKSIRLAYTLLAIFSFQFLMVRLKGLYDRFYTALPVISIPYGAIKRYFERSTALFHRYFNSLWCD